MTAFERIRVKKIPIFLEISEYASMITEEELSNLTDDGRLKTALYAFGGDLGETINEGPFAMQSAVLSHAIEEC